MKSARLWLLLLLAVLLPVRGAVAAAMLCPVAGGSVQVQAPAAHAAHEEAAHEHAHAHEGAHAHVQDASAPNAAAADDHAKGSDGCNLCAAFCSLTPIVGSVPTVAAPADLTNTAFPEFSAPAPSFVSGGPERPPRSI
jgi:hypothetical protein